MTHIFSVYLYKAYAGGQEMERDEMKRCSSCPPGLVLYQRIMDSDHRVRVANQDRLRALKRDAPAIKIFCSHDARELAAQRRINELGCP